VDYTFTLPPDAEFPRIIARMDLFVRFFVAGVGVTQVEVRVIRLNDDGSVYQQVTAYPFTVNFAPTDRVREMSFRLPNVRLTGEGLYAVRIGRRYKHRWKGIRWRTLGTDYFNVVR
jgi:hypothetical protein